MYTKYIYIKLKPPLKNNNRTFYSLTDGSEVSKGCATARVENYIYFITRLLVIRQVVLWLSIKVHSPALYQKNVSLWLVLNCGIGLMDCTDEKAYIIYFIV